jgi:hypothetical protein
VPRALEALQTTEDAGRDRPSHGPAWEAAINAGIDVTLLEHRVRLPPRGRLLEHREHARYVAAVQGRVVAPAVRRAVERRRLVDKLAALGLTPEQALEPIDGDG